MRDPLAHVESEIDAFNARGIALAKKLMGDFFSSLLRPLATVNEAILRKDLGERYFTWWNYIAGIALIVVAAVPITLGIRLLHTNDVWGSFVACSVMEKFNLIAGVFWVIFFGAFGHEQLEGIKDRCQNQILWHSYSSGGSELDAEIKPEAQCGWLMLLGVSLAIIGLRGVGILLALSAYVSLQTRVLAEHRLYNRVLDTIDARIEQEQLEKAIVQRASPNETQGFAAPLRARLPQKQREVFVQAMQPRKHRNASETSVAA